MKGRGVPLGYVEGLNNARTKLADFFNILAQGLLEIKKGPKMVVRFLPSLGRRRGQPIA